LATRRSKNCGHELWSSSVPFASFTPLPGLFHVRRHQAADG
jgi:hypothetical protein